MTLQLTQSVNQYYQSPNGSDSDLGNNESPVTETINPVNISGLLVQQRQILAMMGLDIWVQRDRPTVNVDDEAYGQQAATQVARVDSPTQGKDVKGLNDPNNTPIVGNQLVTNQVAVGPDTDTDTKPDFNPSIETKTNHLNINSSLTLESNTLQSTPTNPIQALKQKLEVPEQKPNPVTLSLADSLEQLDPFEIVGAHFKNWVLIADLEALKDEQQLKLWENILQALSLTPQILKFPICEGISDKESANASVAGFVFRLAKNNMMNVANLTAMPNGIDHPNIKSTPTLTEMLIDSSLKKQLWQSLIADETNLGNQA